MRKVHSSADALLSEVKKIYFTIIKSPKKLIYGSKKIW